MGLLGDPDDVPENHPLNGLCVSVSPVPEDVHPITELYVTPS